MQAHKILAALEQYYLPQSHTGKQHPFVTISNCYGCLKDLHKSHHVQAVYFATKSCNWHHNMTLFKQPMHLPDHHLFIKPQSPRVYHLPASTHTVNWSKNFKKRQCYELCTSAWCFIRMKYLQCIDCLQNFSIWKLSKTSWMPETSCNFSSASVA